VRDDGCLLIDILPPLNKECLQGIEGWSHVWLVFVSEGHRVEAIVSKIENHTDRRLCVSPVSPLPFTAKIVDLKPYHFLES